MGNLSTVFLLHRKPLFRGSMKGTLGWPPEVIYETLLLQGEL
jgi:hypothetical protein